MLVRSGRKFQIEDDAKVFLAGFNPVMAAAIGPMGKNMHLFFFSTTRHNIK